MEPTVQSAIQQDINNKPTIKFISLMIIGIVGLISAYFVINSTIKKTNKAAEIKPTDSIACQSEAKATGYCEISEALPNGYEDAVLVVIEKCKGKADKDLYRELISTQAGNKSGVFDVNPDPDCSYTCRIELGDDANKLICPNPSTESITCEGVCKCEADTTKLCPLEEQKSQYPIEWEPIFEGKNACFQCEKIIVQDSTGEYKEEYFKCDGGRKARLHQAQGEGCREYKVIVKGTINGKTDQEGGVGCECETKLCCPVCAPPEEIKYESYFVPSPPPNAPFNKKNPNNWDSIYSGCQEWETKPETIPPSFITCNFYPPTSCKKNGESLGASLPPAKDLPVYIKICRDDINEGNPKDSELNGHCSDPFYIPEDYQQAVDYLNKVYKDAGKYDIALWCPLFKDVNLDSPPNTAVCIKRVTVACKGGGGPPGGGPPGGGPSNTPTPTQNKCPIVNINGICI